MEHKYQHFVTEAYLKAWCDPKTPKGYEPYVWMVSKKERLPKKKSPKKIFREADFYTVTDSEGNRNVDFEKRLQKIESNFMSVKREKIRRHKPLNDAEIVIVATFVATMFARVKLQRDQQKEMWQGVLDEINEASPDVLKVFKESGTYDQISKLKNQPLPYNIVNFSNIAVPYFSRMNCEIFETETRPGFITSDNPCFMIDPAISLSSLESLSWHKVFRSPTFEVLFPLSPKQLISLKNQGPNRYLVIDKTLEAIDGLNQVTLGNAQEFIVLNQKDFNDQWFVSS